MRDGVALKSPNSVIRMNRFLSALFCALLLMMGTAQARSPAKAVVAQSDPRCGCQERSYTAKPTSDVLALWAAVAAGQEAEFMRLLPRVSKVSDYAVDGQPLLAAILWPPQPNPRRTYWEMSPEETERLVAAHRERLPLRTRMLAAAIKAGASVSDVSDGAARPPLHLAMVFGTPEIVKMLLAAGAQADQRDWRDAQTPLEFMLKQEFFVRMSSQPPLVSRAQRSEMVLALLAAGAQRPFKNNEAAGAREGLTRPLADYLAWVPMVTLTQGGEVLSALAKTGTSPAIDPEDEAEPTALAVAAATGNEGAVEVLRAMLPKTAAARPAGAKEPAGASAAKEAPWHPQLDAALAAASVGNMALAKALATQGMPLAQRGPRGLMGHQLIFKRMEVEDGTLLHFAVRAGDAPWVRQLVGWGAPLEGREDRPFDSVLLQALNTDKPAMIDLLLELGANPLKRSSMGKAPLLKAMEEGKVALVTAMLSRIKGERRAELGKMSGEIAGAWGVSDVFNTPEQRPVLARLLKEAGFDARQVRAAVLASLIRANDDSLARQLVAEGAPVNLEANDVVAAAPLTQAVRAGQTALVDALLAKGASVRRVDHQGVGAVQMALSRGDPALLEKLLRAGGTLDFAPGPDGSALELAISSGKMAMVDAVLASSKQPLAKACITQPSAVLSLMADDKLLDALLVRGLSLNTVCGDNSKSSLLQAMYEELIDPESPPKLGAHRAATLRVLAKVDGKEGVKAGAGLKLGESGHTPLQAAITAQRPDVVSLLLEGGATAAPAGFAEDASPAWLAIQSRQPELLRLLLDKGASLSDKAPSGLTLAEHLRCRESKVFRQAAAPALPEGGACPADRPMNLQDQALAKKVVGHYYLKGVREVGSELLLRPDGSFDYMLAYGAVDELAKGQWRVDKNRVVFTSKLADFANPFKVGEAKRIDALDGMSLRFSYQGKALANLQVALADPQSELKIDAYQPRKAEDYWHVQGLKDPGTVAVRHRNLAGGRWIFLDMPRGAKGEPLNRVAFVLDEALVSKGNGFNVSMNIVDKALELKHASGRLMRYERN